VYAARRECVSLQSGFVLRPRLLTLFLIALWSGCGGAPSYPPPQQRAQFAESGPATLGPFVSMGGPDAKLYIVEGFASENEGVWRWAYEHPVLRFLVPEMHHPKFTMDFSLPERTFRVTGPVTLSLTLNGKFVEAARIQQAGQQSYTFDLPADAIRKDEVNLVSIVPDKVWVSPDDGTKYGYILHRAGFVE
jgi:hypothetical protein